MDLPILSVYIKLEAQVGHKSFKWIRLIMICYTMPWWPSWLSDQMIRWLPLVWSISKLPPWPPSWILELNDLAILNRYLAIKFRLNLTYCWKEMWFEEFQDSFHGGHLGYWNKMILAIQNFRNTQMPPIKLRINKTFCPGADVIWRFSRWLPQWLFWISERNHFSNSKSPCCPDTFH